MSPAEERSYVLSQYHTLCQYCDNIFHATQTAYQSHIRCAQGCASCCLLETVVPLESEVIAAYVREHPFRDAMLSASHRDEQCVLLDSQTNSCLVYPVRPIICRTHGLPLFYDHQPGIDVCPLNFADDQALASLEPQFVLNADLITENLMRLNLAFCIISGDPDLAGQRIALKALRAAFMDQ